MERDIRELTGKKCIFTSTDSEWVGHSGTICDVVLRCDESTYDYEEVGTMWKIVLYDGNELCAFADELELVEG